MKKNNVENILNEPEIRENKRLVDETIQRLLPEKHSINEINLLYQMMKKHYMLVIVVMDIYLFLIHKLPNL